MNAFKGFATTRVLCRGPGQATPCFPFHQLLEAAPTRWHSTRPRPTATTSLLNALLPNLHRPPLRVFVPTRPPHARPLFTGGVVRSYVDLPPDYKDEDGLSFRRRDLTAAEVAGVFGPGMTPARANLLLRVLHGRRVAGTLQDPAFHRNTAQFSPAHRRKALEFLRHEVRVDEVANAGLRAEDELKAMDEEAEEAEEAEAAARTEGAEAGSGDGTAVTKAEDATTTAGSKDAHPAPDPVYGRSVLDEIRARNIARAKVEEEKREEAKRLKELEEAKLGPLAKVDAQKTRELSPQMKQWAARATSDLKEPPRMTAWQRLWPSALFTAVFVAGWMTYAYYYVAPDLDSTTTTTKTTRLLPWLSPAVATVAVLVGLNAAVWVAWKVPPMWRLLNRYFVLVPATVRPASLFFASLSHQHLEHLALNMAVLAVVGTALCDDVGRGAFLALYFSAGVFGYLTSLTRIVLTGQLHLTSLGASTSTWGVIMAYFWLHRFDEFKILGLPPEPYSGIQGLAFIGFFLGLHVLAIVSRNSFIDIWGHTGGMVAGFVAGQYFSNEKERKAKVVADARRALEEAADSDIDVVESDQPS